MKEYYDEVVNIGDNIVELINGEEQTNNTSIKIHSVFLSLEDVATICEFISNDSYEFIPEIKALIAKFI